jgi:hypothetical protein
MMQRMVPIVDIATILEDATNGAGSRTSLEVVQIATTRRQASAPK